MSKLRHERTIILGLVGVIVLAVGAWAVGTRIRSPAQIAAETAAPLPSVITVPVERRVLSTEVVVRGTVRYGAPQSVTLATSSLKQQGGDIVSQPPKLGATLSEGSLAMSVGGRPVFVAVGALPMNRDLSPGSVGADVRQLEQALARLGFSPGAVDDRYDSATAGAVSAWYQKQGWAPFGPTDTQAEQLRAATASAATARDALLQARLALQAARSPATPGEINQARIDAVTADDAVQTAAMAVTSAQSDATAAKAKVPAARDALATAQVNGARDVAAADAEVIAKRVALSAAIDAELDAKRKVDEADPALPPADLQALRVAHRQATEGVTVARAALDAATSALNAAREAARVSTAQAQSDLDAATRGVTTADAQVARNRTALTAARNQAKLAKDRVAILTKTPDTKLQSQVVAAAEREVRRAEGEAARLAARAGAQVPADELLFFPTLPLRIDDSALKRGDAASGTVMTVSNSQLAADSSLSINDAKLVRPGMAVTIEEQDLRITVRGTVTRVADKPGTDKVDPTRFYMEVTPKEAPARLVGTSVRLSIAVKSTQGEVLTVPLSALSIGAGGKSRIQVDRGGGKTEYVDVVPGLASSGLVEIRPAQVGELKEGDLVVVGSGGSIPADAPTDSTGSSPGLGGSTTPGTGSTTSPGTPGTGTDSTTGAGSSPGGATGPSGDPVQGAGGAAGSGSDPVQGSSGTNPSPGTGGATP